VCGHGSPFLVSRYSGFFFVGFTTLTELAMIFGLVQAITFDAFGTLNSARKSGMSPFPTVFILWDTRVHISSFYSGDIPSYIEALIDQTLCFASALDIPNVNPNDRHV